VLVFMASDNDAVFWRAEAERLAAENEILQARVVDLEAQVAALSEKVSVVMADVVGKNLFEVAAAGDQGPVEAFGSHGPDPALRVRICPGGADRGLDDLDAFGGEHLVEGRGEFRIPVTDEEAERSSALYEIADEVASDLGDEGSGRMFGDAEDVHGTAVGLDDE